MNKITEFPGQAASPFQTPVIHVPPGGETDELLDPVGQKAGAAHENGAHPVEKAEEITGHGQSADDALTEIAQAGDADELLDPVGHKLGDARMKATHRAEEAEEITGHVGEDDPGNHEPSVSAAGDACERLQELQVRRRFWIKTITRQDNALGALARRGLGWRYDMPEAEREKMNGRAASLVSALLKGKEVKADDASVARALMADVEAARAARQPMVAQRAEIEREMKRIARALPAAEWQATVRGFGEMGLAVIVGEAGDLANYANPAKLWRRLGLAPYHGHAGKTWAVPKWRPTALSAEEWTEFGYSGQRLAQVFGVVTEPLMKACGGTVYRAVYDHARAGFAERARSPAHAHAHAMRVMTKALVLDLWRVWHGMPPRERELEIPA